VEAANDAQNARVGTTRGRDNQDNDQQNLYIKKS